MGLDLLNSYTDNSFQHHSMQRRWEIGIVGYNADI